MKISVLKQPDVFVREETDDLKQTERINPGRREKNGAAESSWLLAAPPATHHEVPTWTAVLLSL